MNMRMIYCDEDSYDLMMHGKHMFYLLSKNKPRVSVDMNCLYTRDNPTEEEFEDDGFPSFQTNNAGGDVDGEIDAQIHPTYQEAGTSTKYQH